MPFEVFFHTWRRNPNLGHDPISTIYRSRIQKIPLVLKFAPFEHTEILESSIAKLGIRNFRIDEFNEENLARRFNLKKKSENPLYSKQLASCGMWSGLDETKQMFESYLALKHDRFTHFLRMRPDFSIRKNLSNAFRDSDVFFGGQLLEVSEGKIGDQFYGGRLDRSGFILDTMKKLTEITSTDKWIAGEQASLAEDVIRKLIHPFRDTLNIKFLGPEFGELTRPKTQVDWSSCTPRRLLGIQKHNFKVLRRQASRALGE